jgi:hypothetical protein
MTYYRRLSCKSFHSQWWGQADGLARNEVMWEITHRCAACGFWRIKAIPRGRQESEDRSGVYTKTSERVWRSSIPTEWLHLYYTNHQTLILTQLLLEMLATIFLLVHCPAALNFQFSVLDKAEMTNFPVSISSAITHMHPHTYTHIRLCS